MAKRNELRSFAWRLNSGNARGREHIAFGDLISCDQIERFPLEPDFPRATALRLLSGFAETSTICTRPSESM